MVASFPAIAPLLVGGIGTGAIYGLVAVGIVVIMRTTGAVNFAQGEFMTVAGYAYVELVARHANSVILLLAALVAGAALGIVFFAITRYLLRGASELIVVMSTFALSIIIQNLALLHYTDIAYAVPVWVVGNNVVNFLGGTVADNLLVALLVLLVSTAALSYWLRRTMMGRAIRAVAENAEFAALSGIRVPRTLALSWCVAGAFTALGGIFLAPLAGVTPTMGANVLFTGFVAAALGGFGSEIGAMLGGLFLGVLEVFATTIAGAAWSDIASFAVLLVVLLAKPTGLFGSSQLRTL